MRLICGLHHGFITGFAAFRWHSHRVITSLHNVPMATGENGCSCEINATFFNFLLRYMWHFCNENVGIMKSCKPRIFFRGNWQFMQRRCGVFQKPDVGAETFWANGHSRCPWSVQGKYHLVCCHQCTESPASSLHPRSLQHRHSSSGWTIAPVCCHLG